jgi:hypothetical protein
MELRSDYSVLFEGLLQEWNCLETPRLSQGVRRLSYTHCYEPWVIDLC